MAGVLDRDAELIRQATLAIAKGVTGVKIEFEAELFDDPDGYGREHIEGDWTLDRCAEFLMEYLSQFGLAAKSDDAYKPKKPLIYSEVYDDRSVDTEWTVTLGLDKAKHILLLPKLCEAWNALLSAVEEDTGRAANLQDAGMHMALLFGKDAYYSSDVAQSGKDFNRFANFKRSMSMLMPALYFFGATKSDTRKLYFRMPQCASQVFRDHRDSMSMSRYDSDAKFSAIHFVGNALEFRVFDPCYDRPEQLLDNFVVMRNCLRFWRDVYMSPHLEKFATKLGFGPVSSSAMQLKDLYTTAKHLDVLNAGIRKLKPKYLTTAELKQQRGFDLHQRVFVQQRKQLEQEAEAAYTRYVNEKSWADKVAEYKYIYYEVDRSVTTETVLTEDALNKIIATAVTKVRRELSEPTPLHKYIENFIATRENHLNRGVVTLEAN